MRTCHICGERDHQAVLCFNGNVGWKEKWSKTPGLAEKIFNPRPNIWLSEERAKKHVDVDALASAARRHAGQQSKKLAELPDWSKITEVADASKALTEEQIVQQARVCEESEADRRARIAEEKARDMEERKKKWLEEAGLPEKIPEFVPGMTAPQAFPMVASVPAQSMAAPAASMAPAGMPAASAAPPQPPKPQPAAEPPLPEGWASAKAPDGRTYFYHKVTKKTQWSRPDASTPIQ